MSPISSDVRALMQLFADEGYASYIVGGAVRDFILKEKIGDIDVAVECPPDVTLKICFRHHLKFIETGLAHGTITIIVGGEPIEVTSFRQDIATDGRHAVPKFGGTIEQDAARRDFTINAFYMDINGKIHDPLGARSDFKSKSLRFVGEALERIREDYLRILRYFRFLAYYDLRIVEHEIAVMAVEVGNVTRLSPERIGHEMRRLFAGPYVARAVKQATSAGLFNYVAEGFDGDKLSNWLTYEHTHNLPTDWRVRFAHCTKTPPKNWRLSKSEAAFFNRIAKARQSEYSAMQLGYLYDYETAHWVMHMRAFKNGETLTKNMGLEIANGAKQKFPIKGPDLVHLFDPGPELGNALNWLKDQWLNAHFAYDRKELLAMADEKFADEEDMI